MADRLVRSKTTYQASGTTISATFDEAAPLDNTHLLVASIHLASATVISAPSGWTEISGGGVTSTSQTRIFVRQGNGSANSISVTVASAAATLTLFAFSGFVSLTPLWSQGGAGASAASFTSVIPASYTYGVGIVAVGLSATTTAWGTWSSTTRIGSIVNASQRLDTSYVEYTGAQISGSISWSGARTPRVLGVVLPLKPTPMAEYGFNEGTGTIASDSSGNGYALTVNSNAWDLSGKNGSALSGPSMGNTPQAMGLPIENIDGFTISCWVNVATTNLSPSGEEYQVIWFSKKSDGTDFTVLYLTYATNPGDPFKIAYYHDATSDTGFHGSASLNSWHHIAATFDETSTTLYLDGVQIYSDASLRAAYPDRAIIGNSDVAVGTMNANSLQGKIDGLQTFPYKLSAEQITAQMNTPIDSTTVPQVVGTSSGGIINSGSFTVTPPAGAAGYIAIVSYGSTNASSMTLPTPPTGFTLYQSGYNSYTSWGIFIGTAAAGSTWQTTLGWSTSVMVVGLTAFEIDSYANGGPQNTNPTPDQTAPSVTTTRPSLVMRLMTASPWPGTPTGSYPPGNNQTQVFTPNNDEGTLVVLSTTNQANAGSTGTAAFNFSPLDGSTVHTLALRKPSRAITYFDSGWADSGSGTGDGSTVYKQVVITGCQPGDVIVAFGGIENLNTSGTRYVWDVTPGGVKTGTWTELSGMTGLVSDADVDFYAGHAVATSAGSITVQVGLRNNTNGHMGVGAYLIPSSMVAGGYGFVGNGFVGSSNSLSSATLSSGATVLYMGVDWVAQTMGSTSTPSGATVLRSYSDSAYAVWTGMWPGEATGTRNYGPNSLSGRRTAGVLFTLSEASVPVSSRWYTSTGIALKPYRLTGSGLIELQ